MLIDITELHFIRPWWLLTFLPLAAYLIWYWFFQGHKSDWQRYLDPGLAKYVLSHEIKGKANKWLYALCLLIATSLVIFALAGPAWEKIPQPVFKNRAAIVVILDLSRSMDSVDLKPSRLTRAKQKLDDLLQLNKGGQTALIVYAANAYVVTPLTDDTKTIATHIPNLATGIIQAQGSRPDKALLKAQMLLEQAHINRGQIVLLSDSFELNKENKEAIAMLTKNNHRLSIIGVGTAAGAPIVKHQLKTSNKQQTGGFVTDAQGNIVIPKLDANTLRKAAQLGGGRYATLAVGGQDLAYLNIQSVNNTNSNEDAMERQLVRDGWRDMGAYLLLLVIPLFLIGFRRGVLFSFYLVFFVIGSAEPIYAFELPSIFLNKSQKEWRASVAYKQGKLGETIESLEGNNSADALYNKGNAYAKMGEFEQAIEQYEASLQVESDNLDARYNLKLVKKALEQQKQQQQKDDESQGQQGEGEQGEGEQGEGEQGEGEQGEGEQGEGEQGEGEQGEGEQGEGEQGEGETSRKVTDQPLEMTEEDKKKQQLQQWLRRIEDDPSGLLRRKFQYQDYMNKQEAEKQQW